MSRKNRKNNKDEQATTMQSSDNVQNAPPPKRWSSLDHFWHASVKNGTPLLLESFRAHLVAMGWRDDQSRWIEGAKHFGIPVEK